MRQWNQFDFLRHDVLGRFVGRSRPAQENKPIKASPHRSYEQEKRSIRRDELAAIDVRALVHGVDVHAESRG